VIAIVCLLCWWIWGIVLCWDKRVCIAIDQLLDWSLWSLTISFLHSNDYRCSCPNTGINQCVEHMFEIKDSEVSKPSLIIKSKALNSEGLSYWAIPWWVCRTLFRCRAREHAKEMTRSQRMMCGVWICQVEFLKHGHIPFFLLNFDFKNPTICECWSDWEFDTWFCCAMGL